MPKSSTTEKSKPPSGPVGSGAQYGGCGGPLNRGQDHIVPRFERSAGKRESEAQESSDEAAGEGVGEWQLHPHETRSAQWSPPGHGGSVQGLCMASSSTRTNEAEMSVELGGNQLGHGEYC